MQKRLTLVLASPLRTLTFHFSAYHSRKQQIRPPFSRYAAPMPMPWHLIFSRLRQAAATPGRAAEQAAFTAAGARRDGRPPQTFHAFIRWLACALAPAAPRAEIYADSRRASFRAPSIRHYLRLSAAYFSAGLYRPGADMPPRGSARRARFRAGSAIG